MKRLHMLAANFSINNLEQTGDMKRANELHQIMMDFMKYCWENKDDPNLYELAKLKNNG